MCIRDSIKVALTGLESERKLVQRIISHSKNKKEILDLSGKLDLRELISFISFSKIVIAPDTGTGHFAAALGVPLVNLIVKNYKEWKAIGSRNKIENIFNSNGMRYIQEEEIMEAIRRLLKK